MKNDDRFNYLREQSGLNGLYADLAKGLTGVMGDKRLIVSRVLRVVQGTVREHDLLKSGNRILVAVSGGPDSVALLHILSKLCPSRKWELAVAHLHHGLRGGDADQDLDFVREMAKGLKLPFYHRKLPAGYLRRMQGSIQESARRQRYLFLAEIRDQWDFQKIAMGHQADDQAETVLAAILRGAGAHGLGGMPYMRGGTLIRPLLDVTKQEILTYLDVHSIPFRRDPSNEDLTYKRNQIRHELLPLLRERFNPRINERLRQTARVCAIEDAYLENQTEALWAEAAVFKEDRVELPLDQYLDRPKALRYRLLRMACVHMQEGERKPSLVHLDELDRIVKEAREEKWLHLPGGIRCVVGGGSLVIGRVEAFSPGSIHYAVRLPGETLVREANVRIRWEIKEGKPLNGWPDRHDIAYMDLEALRGEVIVRGPIPGDRFRPLGLGGTRKVQDVLVDRQVPRRERWRVPIVVDDLGVVWVVGHRLDERVRIRPETQRMLKATLLPLSL